MLGAPLASTPPSENSFAPVQPSQQVAAVVPLVVSEAGFGCSPAGHCLKSLQSGSWQHLSIVHEAVSPVHDTLLPLLSVLDWVLGQEKLSHVAGSWQHVLILHEAALPVHDTLLPLLTVLAWVLGQEKLSHVAAGGAAVLTVNFISGCTAQITLISLSLPVPMIPPLLS